MHTQRFQHNLSHRGVIIQFCALGDHSHRQIPRVRHPARIRLLEAREDAQQGGFTATVQPHHADPVARLNAQRHLVENSFQPVGLRDIFEVNEVSHERYCRTLYCPLPSAARCCLLPAA